MRVKTSFRHIEPTEALRDYAEAKVSRLEKYLSDASEAHVILTAQKNRHTVEVTIKAGGAVFRGENVSEDLYSSIDLVSDKLARQLRKHRDKALSKRGRSRELEPAPATASVDDDNGEFVRETIPLKPRFPDDVAIELEQGRRPFYVFINAETDEVNVLYLRKDGRLGLMEPAAR